MQSIQFREVVPASAHVPWWRPNASFDMLVRCDPGQERADLAVLKVDRGLRRARGRETGFVLESEHLTV
jgi:hypothetical protein